MPTPRPVDLDPATRAALDALDAAGLITLCECRIRTVGRLPDGRPTLCLPCTIREIGITPEQNAQRIAHGGTLKRWRERDPDEPLPALTWKRWRELTAHIPRRGYIEPRTEDERAEDRLIRALTRAAARR